MLPQEIVDAIFVYVDFSIVDLRRHLVGHLLISRQWRAAVLERLRRDLVLKGNGLLQLYTFAEKGQLPEWMFRKTQSLKLHLESWAAQARLSNTTKSHLESCAGWGPLDRDAQLRHAGRALLEAVSGVGSAPSALFWTALDSLTLRIEHPDGSCMSTVPSYFEFSDAIGPALTALFDGAIPTLVRLKLDLQGFHQWERPAKRYQKRPNAGGGCWCPLSRTLFDNTGGIRELQIRLPHICRLYRHFRRGEWEVKLPLEVLVISLSLYNAGRMDCNRCGAWAWESVDRPTRPRQWPLDERLVSWMKGSMRRLRYRMQAPRMLRLLWPYPPFSRDFFHRNTKQVVDRCLQNPYNWNKTVAWDCANGEQTSVLGHDQEWTSEGRRLKRLEDEFREAPDPEYEVKSVKKRMSRQGRGASND